MHFEISRGVAHPTDVSARNWLYHNLPASSSPLHILLQYQPPLSLVILLIQHLRRRHCSATATADTGSSSSTTIAPPETIQDELGRTPLHIACAYGCTVDVVARLLNGAAAVTTHVNPIACMQDEALMTPLHYACLAAGAARNEHIDLMSLAMVISFLVQVDPNGVKVTNNVGMMPIDFLTLNEHAAKVIRPILSKAAKALKQCETSKCPSVAARVAVTAIPNPQLPVPMEIRCNDIDMSLVTELDAVTDLDMTATAPYSIGCEDSSSSTTSSSSSNTVLMTGASMTTGSLVSIMGTRNVHFGDCNGTETTEWDWCPY